MSHKSINRTLIHFMVSIVTDIHGTQKKKVKITEFQQNKVNGMKQLTARTGIKF